MNDNLHLELGETYVATFPDGSKVEFIVVGGPHPYEIEMEGKRMKHTELLNGFKDIKKKEEK